MFSSPHRPSPPSSLLKTKRKVSGADDSPLYAARYEGGSSPGHGSPSRKHPRLPALNLPQRASFASSSATAAFQGGAAFGEPSSPSSPTSPFNSPSVPLHPTGAASNTTGVGAIRTGASGGIDVDECMSSSEEGELRTPSYPDDLQQYPFGVRAPAAEGAAAAAAFAGGMEVDAGGAGKAVGLMGPQDFGAGVHGPGCKSIPKVVLSHPNPDGQSSLWSVCRDCGATSAC